MHKDLIARRFGTVKEQKLQEVLDRLRTLFGHPTGMTGGASEVRESEGDLRTEEVDEAVLALLYLNAFEDHGQVRSWKTFDWDAMNHLHERGFIGDPKSKAKSVPLTAEGVATAKESFPKEVQPALSGSSTSNRGQAARSTSNSHRGFLPRHMGNSLGATGKVNNSSIDQRCSVKPAAIAGVRSSPRVRCAHRKL